ncbi:MAG: RagB/SusD family nutrient uptake outer membrane protein [Balneolaceae bacterium]|nr:RagB/SusD family nutrient uptake outer membrane protein [Balneolaceae bacterium]
MESIKKLKLVITAFLLASVMNACDLNETMKTGVTASDFYSTSIGFEDLTIAMYEPFRYYYGDERSGFMMTSKGTDIYQYGGGARPFWADYFGITPTVQSMNARGPFNIWQEFYRGINLANSVIDRAESVQGLNENQKNIWVAEAHFLRAHYYHILVQTWGNIHLTLEETQGVETEVNYARAEEVWPHVISDLEFAAANLPPVQSETGRATSGAAKHLLARVHLITENWQGAANLAEQVINDYEYRLEESVLDLWNPCQYRQGRVSPETIFAYTKNQDSRVGGTIHKSREFSARTRGQAGIRASFSIGTEVGRHRPTPFLVTEVFGNTREHPVNQWNDERWKLFKDVWYFNDERALPPGVAMGDTAIYFPVTPEFQEMTVEERDAAAAAINPGARILRIQDYTDELFVSLAYKFRLCDPNGATIPHNGLPIQPEVGATNPDWFGRTVNIFRLAETYLIAAEAMWRLGRDVEAADYFNVVRARAQAPGEVIPLVQPGEIDVDVILDERARELIGEYLRWFDLKRMGEEVFLRRIRDNNAPAAPHVQAYHMLRPIPQEQIDRTTNEFPQNPGY